jgi:RNA polymerase sigma factor (sigma-70 family)
MQGTEVSVTTINCLSLLLNTQCLHLHMLIDGNVTTVNWNRFQAGDKEAFAHFYNLHVEALYRYGTKLCYDSNLLKDAIQEVFLDLYLKRQKNKVNPKNLRFYLILSLKHNLIKKLKRNRRLINGKDCENLFDPVYSIETAIIEDELESEINSRVQALLTKLPAKQKEALYLRFNEAMEYPEIAGIMNTSVESVRKQVYRAILSIRNQLNKQSFVLWSGFFSKKK